MLHSLPEAPSLEHLKNQAKSLFKQVAGDDSAALDRVRAAHPRGSDPEVLSQFSLTDAQLVVAREYGFDSWPKLKAHVDQVAAEHAVEAFKHAVRAGDAVKVRKLLREHKSLRSVVDSPWFGFEAPAIVYAAGRQNRELVDALLDAGANVDARSTWGPGGWCALDQADTETAKLLIGRGASIGIHAAAKHGMIDRVREFVDADPDSVNARGGDGMTPLHAASTVEICEFLLDHGAEIDATDFDHGSTPAQWSIDNPEKCQYLIRRGAKVDIFIAAVLGHVSLARQVLRRDPNALDARMFEGEFPSNHLYIYTSSLGPTARPLPVAAARRHLAFCERMLPFASPSARLIYACHALDGRLVDQVLQETPKVLTGMSDADRGAIADAAWENRRLTVDMMIDAGFRIDWQGREEGTPLERAAIRGWAGLVRQLVDQGASLTIKNHYGGTPLTAAIWGSENWDRPEADYEACVEILIDAGSTLPDRLFGSPKVQELLKRHGVEA